MASENPQHIVFLGMPRCGSNFVCTAIDNHPEFVVHGELFLPKKIGAIRGLLRQDEDGRKNLLSIEYRDRDPIGFVNRVLSYDPSLKFAGFKLFFSHNSKVVDHIISCESIKKIFIRRDNLLAMFSSNEIAIKTGQPHVCLSKKDGLLHEKVPFVEKKFMEYLSDYEYHTRGRVERMKGRIDTIEVTYDEFRNGGGFKMVFDFLGADPSLGFWTRMIKRNPDSVVERFVNPADVEACLKRLGHEEWAFENPSLG